MVQRAKGVGKLGLGIQADLLVKSEKVASSLKPSGSLYQDGKTKGSDHFKRKMKKSRSLSLQGLPLPPPTTLRSPDFETTPMIQQSESRGKSRPVLPNYMRSTTCSDARKENSQVTHLQSTPAASSAKVSRRRCSTGSPRPRLSPGSGKHSRSSPVRNLKRSSSLKLIRTLTKAPSFKPARSTSANKCTQVICADSTIQKATCSSTLKETKHPEYLMLNPGATKVEGTSIFKVCPYTYCSLNGHRHGQLPPLKRFVAARRRLLKAQKSAKVVPVSPGSFHQGSLDNKPAIKELDFETDFFVEIYAKSEKQGSSSTGGDVCVSEDEDDCHGSFSEEGSCMYGLTGAGSYDNSDAGPKGNIVLDKNVEYCCDVTETVTNGRSDNLSQEREETAARDLDEVYYLIMTQKQRLCWSLSQCDVDGNKLLEGAENSDAGSADCKDDDWNEVSYSSSVREDAEELVITEKEEGCDKDTSENEEDQKQEEEELHDCIPRLQEDGMDCASDPSTLSQVSDSMISCQNTDVMNATTKDVVETEAGDFTGDCSQTGSEVSFKEIDGDDDTGAQTMSPDLVLPTEADEAGCGTSLECACFEPQDDAFTLGRLQDLAEENEETAKPLIDAESEEAGPQDEERRAAKPTSDTEVPIELLITGTSSKDSGEADRSITKLEFTQGQESDDSSLHIPTRMDDSGDANNHEGSSTVVHRSEDPAGESPKEDVKKAADLNTNSSVQNGASSMSTKSKGVYSRGKGKSQEELSDSSMIWRINRREKCDNPDDDARNFNPRDPNYLPIVPDPEGERVDLRHQMIDDQRNSDEWMIDYALQRAVSKLAPARKKKVELLVAAFEKVMPVSQFETRIKSPTGITQGRPIQACS